GTDHDLGYSVTVQPDGKIVLGGSATIGSTTDFALVRYNADGSLDNSFGTGGRVTTAIGTDHDLGYSVTVQPDGKIVLGGSATIGSTTDFALVRYNADGSLDNSFGTGGMVTTAIGTGNDFGNSVTLQPDGKIVVGGWASNGSNNDFALVRYNADGSLDTSFGTGGRVTTAIGTGTDHGRSVTVQPDGKIVVAGVARIGSTDDFALVRYNADGSLDARFDLAGTLGGSVSYTENGSPVVLDSDIRVFDVELSSTNFSGATLTLVRNGGASAQDLFSATGTLGALNQGGFLVVGGTTIGMVTTNSGGTLVLSFNSSATN
ncbi:MAG: delta-60 repeat domain-containing protein, partial [Pirellulaceae bacterium]